MAQQPYYRPLMPSRLFADGRSARPLPEGTVPRGGLQLGPYFTGREEGLASHAGPATNLVTAPAGKPPLPALASAVLAAQTSEETTYLESLPFAPAQLSARLVRGRERYNIFCAPCHDHVGNGLGMIVQRGYVRPPSLHTDLSRGYRLKGREVPLRTAPVGYYFDVITNGFGAMPDYRSQIPPDDRWSIVTYVRALQVSQNATLDGGADPAGRREPEVKAGAE